jgi:thymidylate synthase ThyX
MTSAKIITDSISESGIRITTLELEFERFLLSQFNTHRQFSRSAQSSRAVPVQKMIDALNSNETPIFRQSQAGMQAGEIIDDFSYAGSEAKRLWIEAKNYAVFYAKDLKMVGVAKEIANRLIEPFSTVKVVVTATEWQNFFDLRLHHAAQPEMQELAQAMKTAMDESVPRELTKHQWHLPYIEQPNGLSESNNLLISAARCARVSYLNHDNTSPDIEKDLELAQRLLADKHLSPFEHQARPMKSSMYGYSQHLFNEDGVTHVDSKRCYWSGNFRGFIQHRQLVDL